jgi:hypothetical protein
MRSRTPQVLSDHPRLLRVGLTILVAVAIVMPVWALYLAVILPREHVADNWDVVWVGLDLGLAVLAALSVLALRQHSAWTPVLAGALAAALTCDAWFDVMTSRGGDQVFAVGLALLVELPIAAVAAVVGMRSVRLAASARPRD